MNKIKKLSSIAAGFLPEILLLLFFIVIHIGHLKADFWNDEIYSLTHFSLVSTETTIVDYHTTNNHIFYNLINNIYLKFLGISSIYELMDASYILRILPLMYGLVTLIYAHKIVKRFFFKNIGLNHNNFINNEHSILQFCHSIKGIRTEYNVADNDDLLYSGLYSEYKTPRAINLKWFGYSFKLHDTFKLLFHH